MIFQIKERFWQQRFFVLGLSFIIIVYLFLYVSLGQGLLSHCRWDEFTLQAQAWWNGRADLAQDYPRREIAYFENKRYISFPPFPSVVFFVLIPFFGSKTPDNLVTSMYMILSFFYAYKICFYMGKTSRVAVLWALFFVLGNSIFAHSVHGGPWFNAQSLAFLLNIMAMYYLTKSKKIFWHIAFVLWAFSMGCRPLPFLPVLIYMLYIKLEEHERNNVRVLLKTVFPYMIGAFVVFCVYWQYNYARFQNPFEFGHNYLLEFSRRSQFSFDYIEKNFPKLFRLPALSAEGKLVFPHHDGFAFYLANPLFVVFFIKWIKNIRERLRLADIIIMLCLVVHWIAVLSHKNLGSIQFGARYFADALPYVFVYILMRKDRMAVYEVILGIFAIALNIYGSLWLFKNYL